MLLEAIERKTIAPNRSMRRWRAMAKAFSVSGTNAVTSNACTVVMWGLSSIYRTNGATPLISRLGTT
jgi:hypothetical protein